MLLRSAFESYKRLIFLATFSLAFLTFLLGFTDLPWVLSRPMMVQEDVRSAPVIIVLFSGYGETIQDGLDRYSLARIEKGVQLWKRGLAPFILFCGGSADRRGNGLPGAQKMALEAIQQGIPVERIIVEPHSKDTRHNALNSAAILREKGWNSLILVTDDFHMKRAERLFEKEGFQVFPVPVEWHDRGKWTSNLAFLRFLTYEIQARLAYLLLSEKQLDALLDFLRPD